MAQTPSASLSRHGYLAKARSQGRQNCRTPEAYTEPGRMASQSSHEWQVDAAMLALDIPHVQTS
jgi:hypothetical protein